MRSDNELIAEFMGHHKDAVGLYLIPDMSSGRHSYLFREDQLLYSTSWDWLMPVVQRIEHLYSINFPPDFIERLLNKQPTIDDHYMDVIALPLASKIEEAHKKCC